MKPQRLTRFISQVKSLSKLAETRLFRRARELPCDSEEQEAPPVDSPNSPLLDEQREKTSELAVDPSRDTIEFPMEIPPIKRKPTW